MNDAANFIALIEAHEELSAKIRATSRLYFKEAVVLNGDRPERANKIGEALDDLHVPVENNIKRLKAYLNAENNRKGSPPSPTSSGCTKDPHLPC